eukprot:g55099.t1
MLYHSPFLRMKFDVNACFFLFRPSQKTSTSQHLTHLLSLLNLYFLIFLHFLIISLDIFLRNFPTIKWTGRSEHRKRLETDEKSNSEGANVFSAPLTRYLTLSRPKFSMEINNIQSKLVKNLEFCAEKHQSSLAKWHLGSTVLSSRTFHRLASGLSEKTVLILPKYCHFQHNTSCFPFSFAPQCLGDFLRWRCLVQFSDENFPITVTTVRAARWLPVPYLLAGLCQLAMSKPTQPSGTELELCYDSLTCVSGVPMCTCKCKDNATSTGGTIAVPNTNCQSGFCSAEECVEEYGSDCSMNTCVESSCAIFELTPGYTMQAQPQATMLYPGLWCWLTCLGQGQGEWNASLLFASSSSSSAPPPAADDPNAVHLSGGFDQCVSIRSPDNVNMSMNVRCESANASVQEPRRGGGFGFAFILVIFLAAGAFFYWRRNKQTGLIRVHTQDAQQYEQMDEPVAMYRPPADPSGSQPATSHYPPPPASFTQ